MRGFAMVSPLFFYQLGLIALVWLCVMLHEAWPSDSAAVCSTTPEPTPPVPKRHRVPKPFTGLTTKPHCDACEHGSDLRPEAPHTPPPRLVPPRGRRRQVDTSTHFCPNPDCAYRGWVGWGNLRANGHPSGGPWLGQERQVCHATCNNALTLFLWHSTCATRCILTWTMRLLSLCASRWNSISSTKSVRCFPRLRWHW